MPTIGASGAIAGVLGAYSFCSPGARITTLIPLFIIFWTVRLPAILLLRVLVPDSVRGRLPDVIHSKRYPGRCGVVGAYWQLRFWRLAGSDHATAGTGPVIQTPYGGTLDRSIRQPMMPYGRGTAIAMISSALIPSPCWRFHPARIIHVFPWRS